jgi:DNA polymerase-1
MSSAAPSRLLVVDGANALFRAFFAIPGLRASDGTPTNAALGFVNMLNKVLREEQPDAVVVVWDAPGRNFRHEMYSGYKAGRDATPEDLREQVPLVRELVAAMHIPLLEAPGFEADDVIATLVARAPADAQVLVVSTDKDLMQLVSERVTLLDGIRERRYDPAAVVQRFGVEPARILDLRSLVGDSSDNIPGVKGIGEKGAARLLEEWGDLENLLAHASELKAKRPREALTEHADDARLSKRLSTLRSDLDLDFDLADARLHEPDREKLRALYQRLEFTRLLEALDAEPGGAGAPAAAPAGALDVAILDALAGLEPWLEEIARLPCVPLLPVFDERGPLAGAAVGLALALDAERAVYLALGDAASFGDVAERLAPLVGAGGRVAWTGCDTKRTQILFAERGVPLPAPHFDAELAGQLLDPGSQRALPALAAQLLGLKLRTWEELAGRGARAVPAADLPVAELARWAGEQVCAVEALRGPAGRRLADEGLAELFEEVELPLSAVLARMERRGVRVDEEVLAGLSRDYQRELDAIEREVYRLAGDEFLISSPKQLQVILFEKLKLTPVRKTKTGFSTDEGVLEQLSAQHELPARILAFRRLSKLKNTYVDALPPLVNPRTGRIHPTFNQIGAATGRISATNPNVQNIPIRTPEGVRIREAFVPAEGRVLLSADYSQVELRILAHYSGDESLIEAFRAGEDIHRRTAAEVAGIAPEDVDADQRARAKAINFGIIYGSSAFGIANQLGIATGEAQETIDAYFARYTGVRRFLDESIAAARERGYSVTLLGRRRQLPDLASRNRVLRQAAERMAVNSVIQGSAADLIKKAMLAVDAAVEEEGLAADMILQVHDELVFEVDAAEADAVGQRVRALMEGVLPLRVPLVVDVGQGRNWREAH